MAPPTREAFAVLSFMHVPAVAELIDEQKPAQQEQSWLDDGAAPVYTGAWEAER